MLCISTCKWLLHIPFAGRNDIFQSFYMFFNLFLSQTGKKKKKQNIKKIFSPGVVERVWRERLWQIPEVTLLIVILHMGFPRQAKHVVELLAI